MAQILGLDLGKRKDPSALVGLDQTTDALGLNHYALRYARRWDRGTPYTDICKAIHKSVRSGSIDIASAVLVMDLTGVGVPVAEMVVRDLPIALYKVWITGGKNSRFDEINDSFNVAKTLLVSCVGALFASRRLTITKTLAEAPTLEKELDNFQVKISKADNELYEAREGTNDDLVLAAAIACWIGENVFTGAWDGAQNPAARSVIDRVPKGVFLSGPDDDEGYRPYGVAEDREG